jgi:hypothetical protein
MLTAKTRQKRCKACKATFAPSRPLQSVCGPSCGLELAKAKREKAERAQDRVKLERFKTIPQLIAEAQGAFNAYIRARDRLDGHVCISSGRPLDWSGNSVDAGHYRSVGSASHLRFDERNCHAQSKHDNQWKSGNAVDYRLGLIGRIGLEAVEALEADNRVHKWTKDELRGIKAEYVARLRAMKSLDKAAGVDL